MWRFELLLQKGCVVLNDPLTRLYQKVVCLQALIALAAAAGALLIAGRQASVSALAGGIAVIIGSCAYALIARESQVSAISGKRALGRHVLAEFAKIAAVLIVLFAAIASGWFVVGWLVLAMAITLMGHWLVVLIIR